MTVGFSKSFLTTLCSVLLMCVASHANVVDAGVWRRRAKPTTARKPVILHVQAQATRRVARAFATTRVQRSDSADEQATLLPLSAPEGASGQESALAIAQGDGLARSQQPNPGSASAVRQRQSPNGGYDDENAQGQTQAKAETDSQGKPAETQTVSVQNTEGSKADVQTPTFSQNEGGSGQERLATEGSSQTDERRKEERQPAEAEQPVDPLLRQVETAIEINSRRRLDADVHSPWQIMHGVLAYGRQFQLRRGDKLISALDWIASNPRYDQLPLIEVTQHGARFHRFTRPYAFEGHVNQFLALLGSCHLPLDFKFSADGQEVTLQDMVNEAKWTTTDQDELTFTLWALIPYVDPDETWTNMYGEQWSFERIAREQMTESLSWTPCGGTHLLTVLALARNRYLQKHGQLAGVWVEVDQFVRRYLELARDWQNPDGSFSSAYFEGPGYEADPVKRLETSGHILAFVAAAVPDEELQSEWVRRGVAAVARDLIALRSQPVPCGPLYHAVHALVIYRDRVRKASQSSQRWNIEPEAKSGHEMRSQGQPVDRVATTKQQSGPNGGLSIR